VVAVDRPEELIEAMRAEVASVERWDFWRGTEPTGELETWGVADMAA